MAQAETPVEPINQNFFVKANDLHRINIFQLKASLGFFYEAGGTAGRTTAPLCAAVVTGRA